MEEQDTERSRSDLSAKRTGGGGLGEPGGSPSSAREDDRNEELEDSPVPDAEGENTEDEDTAPI